MTDDYKSCLEYISGLYPEVDGLTFYRELFPDNEDSECFDSDEYIPNAIYLHEAMDDKNKKKRRIMLNDTWESDYETYVKGNGMAICSGLTYIGRSNTLERARTMNAMIFDLDAVGQLELSILLKRFQFGPEVYRSIPRPTYVALSGSGVHLYYFFDEPIELFPNIKLQLKNLKYDLTFRIWEYTETSKAEAIQYQSINQSFRMIGSINSKYGSEVKVFRTGERVSIDYLNSYALKTNNRVDLTRPFRPTKITLDQAREQFPDWYERVIVQKNRSKKKWDIAGKVHGDDPYALYHWWLNKADGIVGGHRYYYMMCTAIYASKCDVPKAQLKKDLNLVFEKLRHISHSNDLTKNDVKSALEAYDGGYDSFTIADIDKISGVRIEKNKRNHRKRADHLKLMNYVRDEINGNKDWQNKEGSPTREMIVVEWRKNNPRGRKIDCEKETGLSRKTILKWWDSTGQPEEKVEAVEEKRVNHNSYWKNKQLLKLMKKK